MPREAHDQGNFYPEELLTRGTHDLENKLTCIHVKDKKSELFHIFL